MARICDNCREPNPDFTATVVVTNTEDATRVAQLEVDLCKPCSTAMAALDFRSLNQRAPRVRNKVKPAPKKRTKTPPPNQPTTMPEPAIEQPAPLPPITEEDPF